MKATKCSGCGFVGFADGNLCRRCGQLIDSTSGNLTRSIPRTRSTALVVKGVVAFLAVAGLVVGFFVGRAMLTKYSDPTPQYLAAIKNAKEFKEPLTIRVNRKELPQAFNPYQTLRRERVRWSSRVKCLRLPAI